MFFLKYFDLFIGVHIFVFGEEMTELKPLDYIKNYTIYHIRYSLGEFQVAEKMY